MRRGAGGKTITQHIACTATSALRKLTLLLFEFAPACMWVDEMICVSIYLGLKRGHALFSCCCRKRRTRTAGLTCGRTANSNPLVQCRTPIHRPDSPQIDEIQLLLHSNFWILKILKFSPPRKFSKPGAGRWLLCTTSVASRRPTVGSSLDMQAGSSIGELRQLCCDCVSTKLCEALESFYNFCPI